jgi:DNA repair exonuclease SbcCD nuclease subunit
MLKFLAFTDFHYEKMRFSTTVEDLTEIVNRANENNVDFLIHAGDFCGDFKNSPEIINEYLKNSYNLPCYGVIGNHDLEHGNSVEIVKENKLLTLKINEKTFKVDLIEQRPPKK